MFRTPGVIPLYLASFFARLPNGALGLVLLLRVREMSGSYAAGGVVAGAYGLASGLGQPVLGRMIDRRGQTRVLIVGAAVASAALAIFTALPDSTPAAAAALIAALAGGAIPPLNSCLRALLAEVIEPALRHRAFAIDSTLFELVYISGPLVIVGVVGSWSLQAAVGACGLLSLFGTLAFAATRLSREARASDGVATDLAGPLRHPGVRTLLISVALFGLSISGLEVGLAAFAADEGHRSAVGWLLGLSGVGSMVGGVLAARTAPPAAPVRRLPFLLLALAVLEAPLALMPSLASMGVAVAIAGLAIAPALALTFQIATELAPEGTVTETLTWLSSAIALGLALGAAVSGYLAQHASTTLVLALVAAYTAVEAAIVATRT